MPTDSPQPRSQAHEEVSGFAQAAFDELQYSYKKDPVNAARMYRDLKSDADNAFFNEELQADSCQKLCLLDLAVADIKAESGNTLEASIMFKDAAVYLDKLKTLPSTANTDSISQIARKVKEKL